MGVGRLAALGWAGLALALVVAGCGESPSGIEEVAVDCSTPRLGDVRALATRQELAFDGTVTAISPERNPSAGFQLAFVDDGEDDPDASRRDSEAGDDAEVSEAGQVWPWTTFQVNGWYTADHGGTISIWTAGLDLEVGDRWLIAGQAFATPDGLGEHEAQSGMAAVCASEPYSEAAAAEWDAWFGGSVSPGSVEPEGEPDPADVAAIEAGRDRWSQSGIDTYTATIRTYAESGRDETACGAAGWPVRLVVEAGVVSDAVNMELGCRVDTASVLTIDDLFDMAIIAAGAADEHDYELDPEWGFPRWFYGYDRSIEIDGSVDEFTPRATRLLIHDEIPQQIDELRAQWLAAGIADYAFVLEWRCFCGPEVTGPFLITVSDGTPESISRVDGESLNPDFTPALPATIDELFDMIVSSVGDSDLVVAGFDTEAGYPTGVFIDEITNAVDDELTLILTDLEPL